MKSEWYAPWQQSLYTNLDRRRKPTKVFMPGVSSTSHNLKVALEFAILNLKPDMHSVLFVIAFKNYHGVTGMNMNNEAYTAYSSEGELLIQEGTPMFVLAVQNDVEIKNQNAGFKNFDGKKITIIYLYNREW